MPENVTRPPCPKISTDARRLYTMLADTHEWVTRERQELPEEAQPYLPALFAFGGLDAYLALPVRAQGYHHGMLVQIAQAWDGCIRAHDDCWDRECSVRGRLHLLGVAVSLLNGAFVTSELREAVAKREMANAQQLFETCSNWFLEGYLNVGQPAEAQAQAQGEVGGTPGEGEDAGG